MTPIKIPSIRYFNGPSKLIAFERLVEVAAAVAEELRLGGFLGGLVGGGKGKVSAGELRLGAGLLREGARGKGEVMMMILELSISLFHSQKQIIMDSTSCLCL